MRILRKSLAILSIAALSAVPSVAANAATATGVDPTGDVSAANDITNLTVINNLSNIIVSVDLAGPAPTGSDPSWSSRIGTRELIVPLDLNDTANTIVPSIYYNGSIARVLYFDLTEGTLADVPAPTCPDGGVSTAGNRITLSINSNCLRLPARVGAYAFYGTEDEVDFALSNDLDANDPVTPVTSTEPGGQILLGQDGGIFNLGDSQFYGSTGDKVLNKPVVGMAKNPVGAGYWFVASDGGVFTYGPGTQFHGSQGANRLNQPIVGMASTPTGNGYWLVAADGGIFSHGDAVFYGSTGNLRLNKPIVGMAAAPSGNGYYLVASDGGIFAFGPGAPFLGSAGATRLNEPIVGMATTAAGYRLLARDGGVFNYGDALYQGAPVARFAAEGLDAAALITSGSGYRVVANDGTVVPYGNIFDYGDLPNLGVDLNFPIVGGVAG